MGFIQVAQRRFGIAGELISFFARNKRWWMLPMIFVVLLLGVVLIVLGVAGLFFGHFSFTETKPVLKAGPLEVNSQENHTVWIPTAAGIVVVLAGLGLVMAGRKA